MIIGLEIVTDEGEVLGKVTEILSPGSNDVWVVGKKRKRTASHLLNQSYIKSIRKEKESLYPFIGRFDQLDKKLMYCVITEMVEVPIKHNRYRKGHRSRENRV